MARPLVVTSIILILLVFLVAGGVTGYLAITVPNDVHAEKILKDAKAALQKGERDRAVESYLRVIRDFPRTDAAGAASAALFEIGQQERRELSSKIGQLEKKNSDALTQLQSVQQQLADAQKANEAAIAAAKAAPKPKPVLKLAPARKRAPHRRVKRRHRRSELLLPPPLRVDEFAALGLSLPRNRQTLAREGL